MPLFTIVTTIVFVVFLVILLKKCRVNKTYSFDQDSIELDKVGSKCNISTTATNGDIHFSKSLGETTLATTTLNHRIAGTRFIVVNRLGVVEVR